jgi:hypothetical protein
VQIVVAIRTSRGGDVIFEYITGDSGSSHNDYWRREWQRRLWNSTQKAQTVVDHRRLC